jgi:thioredoxin-like negative regulator of GroEL
VKLADKANFCEIDVDENETLAMQMGVNAMPTFQVLFKGEKKDQLIGASKDKLEAMLETALKLIEEVASEDKKADENKPEVTKPEVKKPEVTKPEVTKPEEKKPEEKTEEKK